MSRDSSPGGEVRDPLLTLTEERRHRRTRSLAPGSRRAAGLGSTLSSAPLCSVEGPQDWCAGPGPSSSPRPTPCLQQHGLHSLSSPSHWAQSSAPLLFLYSSDPQSPSKPLWSPEHASLRASPPSSPARPPPPRLSALMSLPPASSPAPKALPASLPARLGSCINYQTLYPSQLSVQRHTWREGTLAPSLHHANPEVLDPRAHPPGLEVVVVVWRPGEG